MLLNTFCHIPGIGEVTEKRLWSSGLHSWDIRFDQDPMPLSGKRGENLRAFIEESKERVREGNARYFADLLPPHLHWRLFPEFRDSMAYLDIETTGLDTWDHTITTISLYDGNNLFHYVQGKNLGDFENDIERYKVLVTYNGKCFDIPFIQWYFRTTLDHVHIDLRYVLRSLGYSGGLKGCERQLGIDRGELEGVDGFFAVLLWNEFHRTGNEKALETLLAYNMEDTVNLEQLMVMAYNLKLKDTPFAQSHSLALPFPPAIPFRADRKTIEIIRRRNLF